MNCNQSRELITLGLCFVNKIASSSALYFKGTPDPSKL